jgi:hypothetical protein
MAVGRPKQIIDRGGRKRRRATLERIGGFWPHEIENTSIGGRMRVIDILNEQDRSQRRISVEMPAYYSRDFHILILRQIKAEQEAVASMTRGLPADHPMLQLRLIK